MGGHRENEEQVQVLDFLDERYSRLCRGSGLLEKPEIAQIVQDAICFKRMERHLLHAWCVIRNHVHVVLTPLSPHELNEIMHSIKSFSSLKINKLLSRKGALWERESFDHLIRSVDQFEAICSCTVENPVKAGLCATPEEWRFSSAHTANSTDPLGNWIDQRQTPFVQMTGRGELPHLVKDGATYFMTFRLLDAVQ